jgi:16S rRNA (guanine(1405)-N(7))-methyltransferase
MLDKAKIKQLIQDVKKKPELASLDDNFVKDHLLKILNKETRTANLLFKNFTSKSRFYHKIIKLVRADLRRVYGLFREKKIDTYLFSELLKKPRDKNLLNNILKTHSSTKERLPIYESLYKQIFAITGKPNTILDLGCGINPLTIPFMKLQNVKYYAYDVSQDEINQINNYLKVINNKGKATVMDITKLENLPPADVAFLFKMTDMLDKNKGHKGTEEVLKHIPAKFVIVSFATLTMSGKPMRAPRRRWMEWLCDRLHYNYQIIEFPNELFYVIEK